VTVRTASCRCGQLKAECRGDPVRISVCHCLTCKLRSGSAFAAQARWPDEQVTVSGTFKEWRGVADSGAVSVFRFCPECGATVAYALETFPGVTAVPIGAFADPAFPAPGFSVWEERKHAWVEITGEAEHVW
jgi:hypothetical protein